MYTFEFEYLCIIHVFCILFTIIVLFFSGKSYLTGVTCYQLITDFIPSTYHVSNSPCLSQILMLHKLLGLLVCVATRLDLEEK